MTINVADMSVPAEDLAKQLELTKAELRCLAQCAPVDGGIPPVERRQQYAKEKLAFNRLVQPLAFHDEEFRDMGLCWQLTPGGARVYQYHVDQGFEPPEVLLTRSQTND